MQAHYSLMHAHYSSSSSSSPIEPPVFGFLVPFGIAKLGVDGHVMSASFLLNLGFEFARLFLNSFRDLENSSPAGLSGSGPAMFSPHPKDAPTIKSRPDDSSKAAADTLRQLDGRSLDAERAGDLSDGRFFRLTHLGPAKAKEAAFRRGLGDRLATPASHLKRHGVRTAFGVKHGGGGLQRVERLGDDLLGFSRR